MIRALYDDNREFSDLLVEYLNISLTSKLGIAITVKIP